MTEENNHSPQENNSIHVSSGGGNSRLSKSQERETKRGASSRSSVSTSLGSDVKPADTSKEFNLSECDGTGTKLCRVKDVKEFIKDILKLPMEIMEAHQIKDYIKKRAGEKFK